MISNNSLTDVPLNRSVGSSIPPPTSDTFPILVAMAFLGAFGNIGTIWAFCMDTGVRSKPSDFILLSLACADLGVATFILPRQAYILSVRQWPFGEIMCRISTLISGTLILAGEYTVILLSWDRYRMLSLEYSQYLKRHTGRYIAKAIAVTWFIASLKGLIANIIWKWVLRSLPLRQKPNYNRSCLTPTTLKPNWVLVNLLLSVARVLAVAMLGVLIVMKLRARLVQFKRVGVTPSLIRPHINSMELTNGGDQQDPSTASTGEISNANLSRTDKGKAAVRKRYVKPIITYIALVLSLLLCTLPQVTLTVLTHFYPKTFYSRPTAVTTLKTLRYFNCLLFFNSCLNPMLYALTNARIREFYLRRFRALWRMVHC